MTGKLGSYTIIHENTSRINLTKDCQNNLTAMLSTILKKSYLVYQVHQYGSVLIGSLNPDYHCLMLNVVLRSQPIVSCLSVLIFIPLFPSLQQMAASN